MKSILKSKTFWLATLQGVVGVWTVIASAMPDVGWIIIGKSILDIALRLATIEPAKII